LSCLWERCDISQSLGERCSRCVEILVVLEELNELFMMSVVSVAAHTIQHIGLWMSGDVDATVEAAPAPTSALCSGLKCLPNRRVE